MPSRLRSPESELWGVGVGVLVGEMLVEVGEPNVAVDVGKVFG